MKPHDNTDSVRIDKVLMTKIREIAKKKGQTIAGYIGVHLSKQVDRDWVKLKAKEDGFQQSKS
jgi:hypothetical protein